MQKKKLLKIILFSLLLILLSTYSSFSYNNPSQLNSSTTISSSPRGLMSPAESLSSSTSSNWWDEEWWKGMSYYEMAEYLAGKPTEEAAKGLKKFFDEKGEDECARLLREIDKEKIAELLVAEDNSTSTPIFSDSERGELLSQLMKISSVKGIAVLEEMVINYTEDAITMINTNHSLITRINSQKAADILQKLALKGGSWEKSAEIIKEILNFDTTTSTLDESAGEIIEEMQSENIVSLLLAKDSSNNYKLTTKEMTVLLAQLADTSPNKTTQTIKQMALTDSSTVYNILTNSTLRLKLELLGAENSREIVMLKDSTGADIFSDDKKAKIISCQIILNYDFSAKILSLLDNAEIINILFAKSGPNYVLPTPIKTNLLLRLYTKITPLRSGEILEKLTNKDKNEVKNMITTSGAVLINVNSQKALNVFLKYDSSPYDPSDHTQIINTLSSSYVASLFEKLTKRFETEGKRDGAIERIGKILVYMSVNKITITTSENISNKALKILLKMPTSLTAEVLSKAVNDDTFCGDLELVASTSLLSKSSNDIVPKVIREIKNSVSSENFKKYIFHFVKTAAAKGIKLYKFSSLLQAKGGEQQKKDQAQQQGEGNYIIDKETAGDIFYCVIKKYETASTTKSKNLTSFLKRLSEERIAPLLERAVENGETKNFSGIDNSFDYDFYLVLSQSVKELIENNRSDTAFAPFKYLDSKITAKVLKKKYNNNYVLSFENSFALLASLEDLAKAVNIISNISDSNLADSLNYYFGNAYIINHYLKEYENEYSSAAEKISYLYDTQGVDTASLIFSLLPTESAMRLLFALDRENMATIAGDILFHTKETPYITKTYSEQADIVEKLIEIGTRFSEKLEGAEVGADIFANTTKSDDVFEVFKEIGAEAGAKILDKMYEKGTAKYKDAFYNIFIKMLGDEDNKEKNIFKIGKFFYYLSKEAAADVLKKKEGSDYIVTRQDAIKILLSIFPQQEENEGKQQTKQEQKAEGEAFQKAKNILKEIETTDSTRQQNIEDIFLLAHTIQVNLNQLEPAADKAAKKMIDLYEKDIPGKDINDMAFIFGFLSSKGAASLLTALKQASTNSKLTTGEKTEAEELWKGLIFQLDDISLDKTRKEIAEIIEKLVEEKNGVELAGEILSSANGDNVKEADVIEIFKVISPSSGARVLEEIYDNDKEWVEEMVIKGLINSGEFTQLEKIFFFLSKSNVIAAASIVEYVYTNSSLTDALRILDKTEDLEKAREILDELNQSGTCYQAINPYFQKAEEIDRDIKENEVNDAVNEIISVYKDNADMAQMVFSLLDPKNIVKLLGELMNRRETDIAANLFFSLNDKLDKSSLNLAKIIENIPPPKASKILQTADDSDDTSTNSKEQDIIDILKVIDPQKGGSILEKLYSYNTNWVVQNIIGKLVTNNEFKPVGKLFSYLEDKTAATILDNSNLNLDVTKSLKILDHTYLDKAVSIIAQMNSGNKTTLNNFFTEAKNIEDDLNIGNISSALTSIRTIYNTNHSDASTILGLLSPDNSALLISALLEETQDGDKNIASYIFFHLNDSSQLDKSDKEMAKIVEILNSWDAGGKLLKLADDNDNGNKTADEDDVINILAVIKPQAGVNILEELYKEDKNWVNITIISQLVTNSKFSQLGKLFSSLNNLVAGDMLAAKSGGNYIIDSTSAFKLLEKVEGLNQVRKVLSYLKTIDTTSYNNLNPDINNAQIIENYTTNNLGETINTIKNVVDTPTKGTNIASAILSLFSSSKAGAILSGLHSGGELYIVNKIIFALKDLATNVSGFSDMNWEEITDIIESLTSKSGGEILSISDDISSDNKNALVNIFAIINTTIGSGVLNKMYKVDPALGEEIFKQLVNKNKSEFTSRDKFSQIGRMFSLFNTQYAANILAKKENGSYIISKDNAIKILDKVASLDKAIKIVEALKELDASHAGEINLYLSKAKDLETELNNDRGDPVNKIKDIYTDFDSDIDKTVVVFGLLTSQESATLLTKLKEIGDNGDNTAETLFKKLFFKLDDVPQLDKTPQERADILEGLSTDNAAALAESADTDDKKGDLCEAFSAISASGGGAILDKLYSDNQRNLVKYIILNIVNTTNQTPEGKPDLSDEKQAANLFAAMTITKSADIVDDISSDDTNLNAIFLQIDAHQGAKILGEIYTNGAGTTYVKDLLLNLVDTSNSSTDDEKQTASLLAEMDVGKAADMVNDFATTNINLTGIFSQINSSKGGKIFYQMYKNSSTNSPLIKSIILSIIEISDTDFLDEKQSANLLTGMAKADETEGTAAASDVIDDISVDTSAESDFLKLIGLLSQIDSEIGGKILYNVCNSNISLVRASLLRIIIEDNHTKKDEIQAGALLTGIANADATTGISTAADVIDDITSGNDADIDGKDDYKIELVELFSYINTSTGGKILSNSKITTSVIEDIIFGNSTLSMKGIVDTNNDTTNDEKQAAGLLASMDADKSADTIKNITSGTTDFDKLVGIFKEINTFKGGDILDKLQEKGENGLIRDIIFTIVDLNNGSTEDMKQAAKLVAAMSAEKAAKTFGDTTLTSSNIEKLTTLMQTMNMNAAGRILNEMASTSATSIMIDNAGEIIYEMVDDDDKADDLSLAGDIFRSEQLSVDSTVNILKEVYDKEPNDDDGNGFPDGADKAVSILKQIIDVKIEEGGSEKIKVKEILTKLNADGYTKIEEVLVDEWTDKQKNPDLSIFDFNGDGEITAADKSVVKDLDGDHDVDDDDRDLLQWVIDYVSSNTTVNQREALDEDLSYSYWSALRYAIHTWTDQWEI